MASLGFMPRPIMPIAQRSPWPWVRKGVAGETAVDHLATALASLLTILEVIQVNLLDGVGDHVTRADPVIHHQLDELFAVDEDYLLLDAVDVVLGLLRELRGGDQHALLGSIAFQAPCERLDRGTAHRLSPPFRLDMDHVQTEPILLDDSVHAAIATTANRLLSSHIYVQAAV
jgi:hypothetical protein